MHQLPAHAAAPEGVVRDVPRQGPRDHRRAHAGVRVRARHVERARRGEAARDHVSGDAGQPLQDVGQLREPVLARRVPDRQAGPRAPHALRRRRVRPDRVADPPAAQRQRRARAARRRRDAVRFAHAGELPRLRAAHELRRRESRAEQVHELRVPELAAREHARVRRLVARRRAGDHRGEERAASSAVRGVERLHRHGRPRHGPVVRERQADGHDPRERGEALHGAKRASRRTALLELRFSPGVQAYSFTFG